MHDEILYSARILIVDDEAENVDLLSSILRFQGYGNLRGTTDSREVLDLYRAFQPDLILLDLMMPHLDGFQVLEQLRPVMPADDYLPILVITADHVLETKLRALASGARDYLTKPFENPEVRLRIRNLLETRFLHLQLHERNQSLEDQVQQRTAALTDVNAALRTEIMERRQAQESLQRTTEQLRAVFDAVPGGVSWISADLKYLGINQHLAATYDASPEEFIGQPVGFLRNSPEFAQFVQQLFVDPHQSAAREVDIRLRDSPHTYLVVGQKYQQGQAAVFVGIDITARQQAEESLRKAHDELEVRVQERTAELAAANAQLRAENAERQQVQEALSEQKELLQTIFDHIPVMISFFDAGGQFVFANREWERILGWSLDEMRNHPDIMAEFYPDLQDRQRIVNFMRQASGEWADFKTRRRDGRILDTSWANIRLPDSTRIGIGQDVTARKQAEEWNRFHADVLAQVQDAVNAIDKEHRITYWNKAAERLYGVESRQAIGHPLGEIYEYHWLSDEDGRAAKEVVHGGGWWQGEAIHRLTRNGQELRVEATISGTKDEGGAITGYVAVIRDVSARRQAEEQLRLLQSAVLETNESIVITTAELDLPGPPIVFVNPAFTRMTGYTPAEVIGQTPRILQGPQTDRSVLDELRRNLMQGEEFHGEAINYRKDGSTFNIEWHIAPIHDDRGATTHFIAVQGDITARKETEAALRAAKAEADQANRAKSDFLSRMSHELRTPLNAILGFTQLLALDERPPRDQQNLDYILKAGQHLLALINEVLDITHIETGQISFSIEPVHVREVLQEALDIVHPLATSRRVQIHGIASVDHYVLADRQRLKQVLLNLLSNAIKYNHENGAVTLVYEPVYEKAGEEKEGPHALRLKVIDTGPGIAPEMHERLFIAFDRLGAERTRVEGSGIGLALSKRLTEAMAGHIGVESTVGQGSTFWVELPLVEVSSVTSHVSGEIAPVTLDTRHLTPTRTVLYIEDNLPNLHLIESILRQRPGIRLLAAMQGGLGLDLAREHRPDLILLDLHLPDISGDIVLHRLQELPETRHIPVMMLSANATIGQIERLLAAGARAYLTKPINVKQFLADLEELLIREDLPNG